MCSTWYRKTCAGPATPSCLVSIAILLKLFPIPTYKLSIDCGVLRAFNFYFTTYLKEQGCCLEKVCDKYC